MAFPDRRTADILVTILLFAVVLSAVYVARGVIVIFVFAILFAYLIDPVVRFLQRHSLFFRNLRGPHILEAYVAFLVLFAVVVHGLAPGLLRHTGKLSQEIPAVVDGLSSGEIAVQIGDKYGWTSEQELRLKTFLQQHRTDTRGLVDAVERFASTFSGALILIPILALFFLANGAYLADALIQLISTKDNVRAVQSFADELHVMLQHYIRAKVILGGLSAFVYSAAMFALGFPHAIGLGILGGILEFIPVAGWMVSAAIFVSVGFLTHSHWIWMLAVVGLWRMVIDYWVAPRVMGRALEIHPLLEIFAVMVGGAIGGIAGVYLSLPLVAALSVIWRRFARPVRPGEQASGMLSDSKAD